MIFRFFEFLLRIIFNTAAQIATRAQERRESAASNFATKDDERFVVIGKTIPSRRERRQIARTVKFLIKNRYRQLFLVGSTGSGKSNLAMVLVIWDILNGHGLVIMDFRGEGVDGVLRELAARFSPEQLQKRLIIFDMRAKSVYGENEPIVGFNVLTAFGDDPYMTVSTIMEILAKIVGDAIRGVRLGEQLRMSLLALCMSPSGPYTLIDIEPFLLDSAFRARVLAGISDEVVINFFKRFDSGKDRAGEAEAVLNKLTLLLSTHRRLRKTLGSKKTSISLPAFFEGTESPCILICADAGGAGKQVAGIISALFLTAITRSIIRSDVKPGDALKGPLHILCDECANYANACKDPIEDILKEGRKFLCFATFCTQSPGLLDPETRNLLGNVAGNQAFFNQGIDDANTLSGMLELDGLPRPVFRSILQNAAPGEAIFRQQGATPQRINVDLVPAPDVTDEAVRSVRAASFAYWGEEATDNPPSSENGSQSPIVTAPTPATIEVREFVENAATPKRQRKTQ